MIKLLPTKPLRLPRLRTYVPAPSDPKIFWFNSERDDIVSEVVRRIMERYQSDEDIELCLNDAAYNEIRRHEARTDEGAKGRLEYWRGIVRRLSRMSSEGRHETLRECATKMAYDVAGNFDPRVYKFAAKAVPSLLTGVMNPSAMMKSLFDSGARLDELVSAQGPLDKLRALQRKGTMVLVPTHASNLDSIAVAWVLLRENLSPVVYGAGKNLFSNPLVSFFMHNLGAYRVDRRIKAALYKDVLKSYSSVMIERGYHSLFFPGGTRSRSGAIERRLKLGLAGSGVEAFSRNYARGIKRPVYFVPATINYALVLEAETLIDDHLKEAGRHRYIIEDDEFSRVERWISFFSRFRALESACIIRFGEPIDPFGNHVDDEGRSLAPDGRVVDAASYVTRRGQPVVDHARDAAYTRELGESIAQQYERETVVMPTQLLAHVIFRRMVRATPGLDLFSRLRHRGDIAIPIDELAHEVGTARDALLGLEQAGRVHVDALLRREHPERIIERCLATWDGYHLRPVARTSSGSILAEDPNLLLYYSNRVRNFAMDLAGPNDADRNAARDIAVTEVRA
ncbi:MAG: 1-acyl-sn-glycerol-3-phosphate acyltransferase [Deltaproteobacteria bacterium]|nr:1-acyl-sn-glycerol-3-phosphate acyltransferase [Deltaproteobacteria bacterium]MBK8236998.1 1-acyl-sn-glycerol-3-phosphate acyltransferase [Deltaproteobacteria bacterium]MBP7290854.1 1-acyl-sn-glycerol-3-phosphate acyltransferase [Nannocystaceae bacterium]